MLRQACHHLKSWHESGHDYLDVFINVSANQFQDPDFADKLKITIDNSAISPNNLILEFNESYFLRSLDSSQKKLRQLEQLGVTIALDNFGEGIASLKCLSDLPINIIKISRHRLSQHIGNDSDLTTHYLALIQVARWFNIKIIISGIETAEQLRFFSENNCDLVQGFLFLPPQTGDSINNFILNNHQ